MRIILRYGGTAETSKSYFGEPVCEIIVAGDKSILPMETQQQRPPYALVEGLKLENFRAFLACRLGLGLSARPRDDPVIRIGF
ncbi:MAG: hypothetical protein KAY65_06195 [Planctomycetes bacterium]|nr:hypothetical protein [Planctomycetota bacterium]